MEGQPAPDTAEARQRHSIQARTSLLMAVGFAALLLVIAVSSFVVWRNFTASQRRATESYNAHLQSQAALDTLRANVYLIGILTRDYLLDPNPTSANLYLQQFVSVKEQTEASFQVLESFAHTDAERTALGLLRQEIAQNYDPAGIILSWSPGEMEQRRAEMMRERLRQRQEIVALAGSVEEMISANFTAERQRRIQADQDFQRSLGWTMAIAFFLTFAVTGVTFARLFSLGRQSQTAESQLRLLSVRLRTAQEEERRHLSRELHDQVGQMLTGLRMELALIARLWAGSNAEFSTRIAQAKGTAEQTLQIVRNIAMLLRPSMLDDLGLSPALSWLVSEISRTSGIPIRSDIDPQVDKLPDGHRTCMYRVVQEALTNVSRHSGAHSAEVTIRTDGKWIAGTVSDDGNGFEPNASRRLGILGMEERVRELGGSIHFTSSAGNGTRIEIRLPNPMPSKVEA